MMMKIILALLGLTYAVSPYDLLPDFFVGVGWIDDIIVLILMWKLFQYYQRRRSARSNHTQGESRTSYGETREDRFYEKRTFGAGEPSSEEAGQKAPHEILGVDKNASDAEIKNAYRRLAAQYHPDKVVHLGKEFRDLAERRFKEIQRAYQELNVK